ncbi:hypothetical protein [Paraoerskovia sediminicola]
MLARGRALTPAERVLYGGSTLVRWARTFAASSDRGVLRRAGAKGLRDGVRRGPRATAQVLAGLGPVSDDVAALEGSPGTKVRRG